MKKSPRKANVLKQPYEVTKDGIYVNGSLLSSDLSFLVTTGASHSVIQNAMNEGVVGFLKTVKQVYPDSDQHDDPNILRAFGLMFIRDMKRAPQPSSFDVDTKPSLH